MVSKNLCSQGGQLEARLASMARLFNVQRSIHKALDGQTVPASLAVSKFVLPFNEYVTCSKPVVWTQVVFVVNGSCCKQFLSI